MAIGSNHNQKTAMISNTDERLTYLSYPNGVRAIHLSVPGCRVGYFGVAINAGSRHEGTDDKLAGLAHFVEHTIFKGTARRSSYHIINRMEAVGGELNAFTTKEDTVVYTAFPKGNLSRAIDLVADLVLNSRFPDKELNKERQVVADEVNSYLDSPADAVFDDFEDIVFKGNALGHNILGSVKSLRDFDSQICRKWVNELYTSKNMVIFYAGNVGVTRFDEMLSKSFVQNVPMTISPQHVIAPDYNITPTNAVKRIRGNHQAHVVIGKVLPAMDNARRATVALLSNILGGPGMNSLLNVELREHRGLVYNVEASTSFLSDCGLFTIYFGCDAIDRDICQSIVTDTLTHIAEHGLTQRQLSAAKKQYVGQLILANENLENRITSLARSTLIRGHALTSSQMHELLDNISNDMIMSEAQELVTSTSSLALVP